MFLFCIGYGLIFFYAILKSSFSPIPNSLLNVFFFYLHFCCCNSYNFGATGTGIEAAEYKQDYNFGAVAGLPKPNKSKNVFFF